MGASLLAVAKYIYYKSKMANKIRVEVANLKLDLQSESYRFIQAIMHFCDALYSKI